MCGGVTSHPKPVQTILGPGAEANSIDFSQSVTQILSYLGKNLNVNPKERFAVVSTYTDTWKETMTTQVNSQEERFLGLECQLFVSKNAIEAYKTLF